jgi:ABC-type multidrug transport system ATPase subunit
MQRRVAVVRAVLSDARILIMDEPLSGLDDGTKTIVTDYIRSRQQDRPWILTVHEFRDLPFAKEYRLI